MSEKVGITISKSWCKGCEICVDVCPRNVLVMNGFAAKVKDLEKCTFCMLCEQLCPDFAIIVHPPDKKKKLFKE